MSSHLVIGRRAHQVKTFLFQHWRLANSQKKSRRFIDKSKLKLRCLCKEILKTLGIRKINGTTEFTAARSRAWRVTNCWIRDHDI